MASISMLDPFNRIKPGPFISQYEDWIIFTLLLFFFWSIVGIALKQRFKESRHLRVLITSTALMMTIGTYYSIYRGWLHLSLQGLGLLGAALIFIAVFFVVFGLMRGYGMKKSQSLCIGYALVYISLWAVSPTIYENLADIFPPLNAILLIMFIFALWKSVTGFFRHARDPNEAANELKQTRFTSPDDAEIDQEIKEDKQQNRQIKKQTMKVTKVELKTLAEIEDYLKSMIQTVKAHGNSLQQQEQTQMVATLRAIYNDERILQKGLNTIRTHILAYSKIHRRDIPELEKRLQHAKERKNKKNQAAIFEEIQYQKTMLKALDFMNRYESTITEFTRSFNQLIYKAIQNLKSHYPSDALSHLHIAHKNLIKMKHIYDKQRDLEKSIIKFNKKTIKDLKKEKAARK